MKTKKKQTSKNHIFPEKHQNFGKNIINDVGEKSI